MKIIRQFIEEKKDWIKFKDFYPNEQALVLVYSFKGEDNEYRYFIGRYSKYINRKKEFPKAYVRIFYQEGNCQCKTHYWDYDIDENTDYWMPLPEKPQ